MDVICMSQARMLIAEKIVERKVPPVGDNGLFRPIEGKGKRERGGNLNNCERNHPNHRQSPLSHQFPSPSPSPSQFTPTIHSGRIESPGLNPCAKVGKRILDQARRSPRPPTVVPPLLQRDRVIVILVYPAGSPSRADCRNPGGQTDAAAPEPDFQAPGSAPPVAGP